MKLKPNLVLLCRIVAIGDVDGEVVLDTIARPVHQLDDARRLRRVTSPRLESRKRLSYRNTVLPNIPGHLSRSFLGICEPEPLKPRRNQRCIVLRCEQCQ